MPVYACECGICGRESDYFATVAERNDHVPECCGQTMNRIVSASFVQEDIPAYVSPTTGRVISSRAARRDDLRRSNCRPWEGFSQERTEAARQRAYVEEKNDAKLTDAAHRAWHDLPSDKRAILDGSE